MDKRFKHRLDNVKDAAWFIVMVEVFILFLAIIVGGSCGYKISLLGFGILGAIIGFVLICIVMSVVAIDVAFRMLRNRFWKR